MRRFMEDPRRVLILGAGSGGTAVLEMLRNEELVEIVGVVDTNPAAQGMLLAEKLDIPVYNDIDEAVSACAPCVAFNLTGNEMVEDVVSEVLGVGGVIGGLEAKLIVRMINQINSTKDQLRYEATHDHLTGVYNRRHIMTRLQEGLAQSLRYDFPYSVVLIDLDHFKSVNDTYGHAAGDMVLTRTVMSLLACIREADTLGRWGGEEFIVLLPHTAESEAIKAAQKWLAHVCAQSIAISDEQQISVSFSAGVACFSGNADEFDMERCIEQLLHQADINLYRAKDSGRNRICGTGENPS